MPSGAALHRDAAPTSTHLLTDIQQLLGCGYNNKAATGSVVSVCGPTLSFLDGKHLGEELRALS